MCSIKMNIMFNKLYVLFHKNCCLEYRRNGRRNRSKIFEKIRRKLVTGTDPHNSKIWKKKIRFDRSVRWIFTSRLVSSKKYEGPNSGVTFIFKIISNEIVDLLSIIVSLLNISAHSLNQKILT